MAKDKTWEEIKQKKNNLFEKELENFVNRLRKIRGRRVSLELLHGLSMNYQGKRQFIKSFCSTRINNKHEIIIQVDDLKVLPLIIKSVIESNLGFRLIKSEKNEAVFALDIFTDETRKNIIVETKSVLEKSKAVLRSIRDDFRSMIKKEADFSKDEKKRYEIQIDKIANEYQEKLIFLENKKLKELD